MTNLKQPVLDKIKSLGDTEAAKYFGKSRQTIYAWKTGSGAIPLTAVEKVMNEAPKKLTAVETEKYAAQQPVAPLETEAPLDPIVSGQKEGESFNDMIVRRLNRLEEFARSQTDPDRIPSVTRQPAMVPVTPPAPPTPEQLKSEPDPNSPLWGDINKPRPVVRK